MMTADRMRVGFDVSALGAETQRAGIGRYAWELLAALGASGEHAVVPVGNRSVGLPEGSSRSVLGPRLPSRSAWTFGLLPLWLPGAGLDVFHATSYYAPLRAGVPTVVTIHDLGVFVHPEFHPRGRVLRARAVLPRVARNAAAIIVPTRSVEAEVVARLGVPRDRVHVVPEAPGPAFTRSASDARTAAALARYGLEPGFFLAVGALEPRKNLARVAEALSLLRARRDARLVVAGPKGWRFESTMDRVGRLNLDDRIRFLGFVPDDDLVALMAGAAALVYPSLYEGFGLPIVEAMAAGLPVITSQSGATAEVAGGAALLADPLDVESIASTMRRLLDDPDLRARLAAAGRARAAEYSWSRTATETTAVYRYALGAAPRPAEPAEYGRALSAVRRGPGLRSGGALSPARRGPDWRPAASAFAFCASVGAVGVLAAPVLAAGATREARDARSAADLAPGARSSTPSVTGALTRAPGANPAEEPPRGDAFATLTPVERGVVEALAYADVFDWPLTAVEVHRYLSVRATIAQVEAALAADGPTARFVERHGDLAMLRGRGELIAVRRERAAVSARLWPRALRYARIVGALPFVRMVAITGSLAPGAARRGDDVDLFVVTEDRRLWLARACSMMVVRIASRRGLRLCPNYLVAESALELPDRSHFAARELAQMVPVVGAGALDRLIAANSWHREFLPNAEPAPAVDRTPARVGRARAMAEAVLRSSVGDRFERWEMRRKTRRLREASASSETRYDETCCKGHANEHGRRILAAFETRLNALAALRSTAPAGSATEVI